MYFYNIAAATVKFQGEGIVLSNFTPTNARTYLYHNATIYLLSTDLTVIIRNNEVSGNTSTCTHRCIL